MKNWSLSIVERATLAYNGVVLALILLFHARIQNWSLLVWPNIIAIAATLLLARLIGDRSARLPSLVRNLAPLGLFLPLYAQTGRMNHLVFKTFLDPLFVRIEGALFGLQPAIEFAKAFPQAWVSEYMHFAYASYYALFPGLALFLFLRRDRAAFLDYLFSLCATMYACLLMYILLPVRGALSLGVPDAPGSAALPFTTAMAWIYQHLEVDGAAFPSSHVAIAALVLVYTLRYARSATWIVGPLVASLIAATVYCRYHYAIDVLGGLLFVAILLPLWRRISRAVSETGTKTHRPL